MATPSSKPRRLKLQGTSEVVSPSPSPRSRDTMRSASQGRPPVRRGSSSREFRRSPSVNREPLKTRTASKETEGKKYKDVENDNENKLREMVNSMIGEYADSISSSFATVIGDAIAQKTLELSNRIMELEFELKTRPTKSDVELSLQSKVSSDHSRELEKRIEELEDKVMRLEATVEKANASPTPPTVLEVSEIQTPQAEKSLDRSRLGITKSDSNIYLDEMERLVLQQVNTSIEQRHSSLPRDFESTSVTNRARRATAMFIPKSNSLSGIRIRDILGRWCEDASGAFWTVRSDGIAICDTGAKLSLREKNKQGTCVVSRSDGMVIDTSSDHPSFILWRSKISRSAQPIRWTRYLPSKHSVELIRPRSSNAILVSSSSPPSVGNDHGDDVAAENHEVVHHEHRVRGSVAGPRKASRPSALRFLKVMRKGVLIEVLAGQLVQAAQAIEPSLTSIMESIASESGGELVGLDYKLKTPESLAMKIGIDVHDANLKILEDMEKRRREVGSAVALTQASGEKHQKRLKRATMAVMSAVQGKTERTAMARAHQEESDAAAGVLVKKVEEEVMKMEEKAEKEGKNEVDITSLVWSVSDAVRYTVLIPTERYTASVKKAIKRLKGAGMTPASLKNYWGEGDGYQGINDVFYVPCEMSPTGKVKVEIQFHTPESFKHKMAVHGMYEEFRSTRDPTRKVELWKESVAMADEIPVPKGVLELPKLTTQPMPIENTLYVDLIISRGLRIQQSAVDMVTKVCANLQLPDHLHNGIVVHGKVDSHLLSPNAVEMRMDSEIANAERRLLETLDQSELSELSELKLKDAALKIEDALVVTVVFDSDVYASATEEALSQIFKTTSMVEVNTFNAWTAPMVLERSGASGGVGVYTHVTMEGEDDGVAFTPDDAYPLVIAFHTQESLTTRIGLQAAWSEYRAANTSKQRNAAMTHAHRLSSLVPVPTGARSVRGPKWLMNAIEEES